MKIKVTEEMIQDYERGLQDDRIQPHDIVCGAFILATMALCGMALWVWFAH